MKVICLLVFWLVWLIGILGCKPEESSPDAKTDSDQLVLPKVLDLMEYHKGTIVAEGDLDSIYLEGFGEMKYGDLSVEYIPKGEKAGDNAFSLIIRVNDAEVELILPNATHRDFHDLVD